MSTTTILICIALGLAAVGVTWWVYGGGPLLVALAVLVAVCPLLALWVMRQSRNQSARPNTRGDLR
ncbi:MAG: hypothetical protein MUC55_14515 [Burkholderiales bacterium]|jgi:Flp pilus assembly protein TadB|nr:hypothetical protein [Burkholderiales bacterium]